MTFTTGQLQRESPRRWDIALVHPAGRRAEAGSMAGPEVRTGVLLTAHSPDGSRVTDLHRPPRGGSRSPHCPGWLSPSCPPLPGAGPNICTPAGCGKAGPPARTRTTTSKNSPQPLKHSATEPSRRTTRAESGLPCPGHRGRDLGAPFSLSPHPPGRCGGLLRGWTDASTTAPCRPPALPSA